MVLCFNYIGNFTYVSLRKYWPYFLQKHFFPLFIGVQALLQNQAGFDLYLTWKVSFTVRLPCSKWIFFFSLSKPSEIRKYFWWKVFGVWKLHSNTLHIPQDESLQSVWHITLLFDISDALHRDSWGHQVFSTFISKMDFSDRHHPVPVIASILCIVFQLHFYFCIIVLSCV